MIKARGITKRYGKILAVDNIDIEVEKGEIYAFLGPNGAGKTTTVKILSGITKPDSGSVEIAGMDVQKRNIDVKRIIGVVPEEPSIYPSLKGWEFLEFVMKVFDSDDEITRERLKNLVEIFNMDFLDKLVGEMSHGMRQKLMVVSVLMRKPKVIFLDEPTVGLDPISIRVLKELLKRYSKDGVTIFLTTHILDVAQDLADRIGIIHKGRMIAQGTLERLREIAGSDGNLEDLFIKLTGSEEFLKEMISKL